MKKQTTSLGQKFRNLFAQEMRSDTGSATTLLADEKTSYKNKLAKRMIMGAVAMAISLGASTLANASVLKLSKNQPLGTAKIQNPIINNVGTDTTVATSCNSYTWAFDGNTYTQSGFYTSTVGAITNVLNLTIQNAYPLSGQIPNPAVFPGGGQSGNVIGSSIRRVQCLYDASNWTGQGVTGPIKITKLDLRALTAVAQSRTYSSVEIHLQQANVDYLTPSTTFANNRTSALGTPNYSGSLTVNAGDSGAFLVQIPLTVPFTYNPNLGDLLVEIVLLSAPSPLSATNIDCGYNAASHKCNTVRSAGSTTALIGTISAFAPILRTAYIPISVSASSCGSYNWNFNGQTYTQSGSYTHVNTCGDTLTLNLTIKPSSTSTTTESAIGSYTWNGNTYTTSGTYTWTGTNSVGCDSVATLNLTILSNCTPTSSTETITACNSYAWNGTSYTASGTYTWTGTNAAGCDSVVTLNLTITPQPAQPTLACYETASFNTTTCSWDVTGTQPSQPSLACYESANFNTTTCQWDVTGTQPQAPTGLACYETANFNSSTCQWNVTGSQPAMPGSAVNINVTYTGDCGFLSGTYTNSGLLNGYYDFQYNANGYTYHISYSGTEWVLWVFDYATNGFMSSSSASNGLYPPTTGWTPTQCVVGSLSWNFASPLLACYQTANFNTTTCSWDITGTQPSQPSLACYESANFNTTTCSWDVTGSQPSQPSLACYETATFNTTTCSWDVTGSQPSQPSLACYESANFNTSTCQWDVTGSQPTQPTLACYESANFNTTTCTWDVTGSQPAMPTLACYQTANFNTGSCSWVVTGTQPAAPTGLACYQTANFNTTSCSWVVTGSQPAMPTLACGQTASFNSGTCAWVVTTPPPASQTIWTENFDSYTIGALATDATGAVAGQGGWYIFNSATGTTGGANSFAITADPVTSNAPNKAVKLIAGNTTTGNNVTRFAWTNNLSNSAVVTGGNYEMMTVKYRCYIGSTSTTSTNRYGLYLYDAPGTKILAGVTIQNSTGQLYIVGSYNNAGTIANYSFSTGTTGILSRNTWYDLIVTFNKVTGRFQGGFSTDGGTTYTTFYVDGAAAGVKPDEIDLIGSVNSGTAAQGATAGYYDNINVEVTNTTSTPTPSSSTQTVSACGSYNWHGTTYTSSNNTATWTTTNAAGCDSIVTLNLTITTPPAQPSLACYQTAVLNTATCTWTVSGTQPSAPTGLACYETASFNTTSCSWVVTGSQPSQPSLACYQTASFNTTTCTWDVTGSQPSMPSLACYETASFNSSTCVWDVTGSQPSMPSLACYETASFNSSTCVWDVTGSQPSMPTLACYETASFNSSTCVWDVTGAQPSMPSLACYETASFNSSTCVWDVTGSQPTQPTLACYESANFNTGTCQWDVTGTQPSMPSLACYETATFNSSTCVWDVTGSPAAAIVTTTTGCDSYVWSANGTTYTQSGTYNYSANCQDYTLNLTINNSTLYYADVDGDGYGNAAATSNSCNGAPTGYVAQAGDCNDNNLSIYPGATEVCGNGIDDNCDGSIDEGTSVTANPIVGNLQICNLYANAKTLTTATLADAISYNWTVPSDMTITSGQGTNSIVVSWGNINLLQNGIIGNVTVTPVLSTSGCVTVVPASIPVDLQYTAPVTPPSISGPSAICPNESGVYSIALVKRASSYEWSVPTGASITNGAGSNIINVSYANGFAGGNVTVGAKNVCGLSTPLRTRNVTLNVLPAPASITGPVDGLCNASNANYLASSVVGATGYNWTVPANASINSGSNSNNISANFNSSFTTGNITVAAVNNCGVGATRSLAVKAAPAIPGAITGPATACAGSNQSYSISTVQGASNYVWTVPGGAIINSGQGSKNLNINHSTVASANGIITVKSSNACGTSTAKVLSVVTTACPRLGDATTQLEVYPNPASSYINISFNTEQSQKATIILRDAAGRIVYNELIDAAAGFNNQQIELSNFSKGVYFVQLQTTSSSENTRLIVD